MLAGAARAHAALDGRDFVIPDDVKALAPALLRHRVILSPAAEINGRKVEEIVLADHRDDRGAALIYPTRAAVIVTAAGAPVALAVAAVEPGRWFLALAWPLAIVLLYALDALRGARDSDCAGRVSGFAYVGGDSRVHRDSVGRQPVRGAHGWRCRIRRWSPAKMTAGCACRSTAAAARSCFRSKCFAAELRASSGCGCAGPARLGLPGSKRTVEIGAAFPVLPDLRPVHDQGARVFQRYALEGLIAQLSRGEGSDFDTLVDFRTGMDRRAIDWKQSARHMKLLAKQYRTERNNQIVFAVDTGRQMCEPVAGHRAGRPLRFGDAADGMDRAQAR